MSAQPIDDRAQRHEASVCELCGLKVAPGPGGRLKHQGPRRSCGRQPRPIEASSFTPELWPTEDRVRAALGVAPTCQRLEARMGLADWRDAAGRQSEAGRPPRKRGRRADVPDEVVERTALLLSRSWRRSERGHGKRAVTAATPTGGARS